MQAVLPLIYSSLTVKSPFVYMHFIFRNGDRSALFNEHRTSCQCFLCLDFSGSVGKVERDYSDAGFRDRRVPFCSSDIPSIAKYLWLCSVITDSVLRHPHWEDILDPSLHYSAPFGFTAEAYLNFVSADGCCPLSANLAHLFIHQSILLQLLVVLFLIFPLQS